MQKSIYLIGLVVITLMAAGCGKSGGGTTQAYAPNSCYNNNGVNSGYVSNGGYPTPYGAGGYNNGYANAAIARNNTSGIVAGNGYVANQRYQMVNLRCIDTQSSQEVTNTYCVASTSNYSYNASCSYNGYGNGYYAGGVGGAYSACSMYTPYQQFYPIYNPMIGQAVCVGYSFVNTLYSYGTPAYYPGYANTYMGCIPGVPTGGCNCNGFGGSLGWFSQGIALGICFN